MLKIKGLRASVGDKEILKGLDLEVAKGEVHAIMGPNGSGKSTLSNLLAGNESYLVSQGSISFCGKDLLEMSIEDRANEGLFMSFQYPVEIPGISVTNFLKTAINSKREHFGQPAIQAKEFMQLIRNYSDLLNLKKDFLSRSVNVGFSGGEKKKNEILQMAMLQPKLAILDETDSGLDVDALRTVASGVNALKNAENSVIVITHYQRLLDYIVPDFVHILKDGKIIQSGTKDLALEVETKGYDNF